MLETRPRPTDGLEDLEFVNPAKSNMNILIRKTIKPGRPPPDRGLEEQEFVNIENQHEHPTHQFKSQALSPTVGLGKLVACKGYFCPMSGSGSIRNSSWFQR